MAGWGTVSCVPVKSGGTSVGLSKSGVAAIDVSQEEIGSGQCAGLGRGVRAAQFLEARKPDQRSQRQPVAGGSIGRKDAHMKRPEG